MKIFSYIRTKVGTTFSWYWYLSWKKKFVVTILLLGLLIWGWRLLTKKGTVYTTDIVISDTVTDEVSETGNVHGSGLVEVTSPATGIIKTLFVTNGDRIEKGDKLMVVESTATEKEKAAAYAEYMAATTALGTAKANQYSFQSTMFTKWKTFREIAQSSTFENDDGSPKNNERTLPEFHTAQDDWLAAEAQYKNQEQAIAQAQAAVTNTSLAYQATQNATILAPISGVIRNISYAQGDSVKASIGTTTNPVLIITTGDQFSVKIQVNEIDINKIALGQKATITFDAIRNSSYPGTVIGIDSIGTNTSGVITYGVLISIDQQDPSVKSEMTAHVSLETAKHEHVLTVANSAVKPYQGGKAVQVITQSSSGKQSIPVYVKVKTGIKGATRTEIIEGVSAGTVVVTGTSTSASVVAGLFRPASSPTPTVTRGQ